MRKIAAFALALCIGLSMITGCDNVKEPDETEKTIIIMYLSISHFGATYSGSYALSTDIPKEKIGDIEFITWPEDADSGFIGYTPKKEVSFSDFGAILAVFTAKYGEPTYSESDTYTYQWLSEDESFSLTIVYSERILNHFAMCVETK